MLFNKMHEAEEKLWRVLSDIFPHLKELEKWGSSLVSNNNRFITRVDDETILVDINRVPKADEDWLVNIKHYLNTPFMEEVKDEIYKKCGRFLYKGVAYQHFKGGLYRVINVARDSETGGLNVIYESLDPSKGPLVWSRPVEEFLSDTPEKYRGMYSQVQRFKLLERSTEVSISKSKDLD